MIIYGGRSIWIVITMHVILKMTCRFPIASMTISAWGSSHISSSWLSFSSLFLSMSKKVRLIAGFKILSAVQIADSQLQSFSSARIIIKASFTISIKSSFYTSIFRLLLSISLSAPLSEAPPSGLNSGSQSDSEWLASSKSVRSFSVSKGPSSSSSSSDTLALAMASSSFPWSLVSWQKVSDRIWRGIRVLPDS